MFVNVLLNSKKMKSGIFGAESNSRPSRGALMTEQKFFSHTKCELPARDSHINDCESHYYICLQS